MDIAKLEKMKVVDLRNELQTRGLDTKGVKAVLIERLRAHIDGGGGEGGVIPGTPGTPGRRSRRTRSMTRSPSPSPVKITEQLEPLEEESNSAAATSDVEEELESPIEDIVGEAQEDVDEPYTEEQVEEENNEVEEAEDIEMNEEEIAENVNEEDVDMHDNNIENRIEETIFSENNDASTEQEVSTEQPNEDHEEKNTVTESEENTPSHEIKENIPSHEIKENQSMDRDSARSRKRSREHSRSHSRSRSRSSKHRSEESTNASPIKGEESANLEDEPTTEDKQFGLSWYDSDLHLRIDPVTFTSAKPMTHEIYSLVWSGVRANYGVREGKVCFEVRLAEEIVMNRSHQFRNEPHVRGFRVGFSIPNSSLVLGEEENSFAYCETGRKAVNSEFTDYGKPYKLDDVIGCYLDLESTPCTIKYTFNGEDLGVAFEFDKAILGESDALFPHIVTKGYEFHVNFADNENILANVVRPTRMRRKIRESTLNDNTENCEVIDEPKMSEDEKPNETNEDKQTETESDGKTEVIFSETAEATTNKEVEINKENTNIEDAADTENNSNSVAVVTTAENGDDNDKTEKSEKTNSEGDKEDGPSPTKRAKVEDKDKANQSEISEDEYEEVLPEPREPVFLLPDYELIALIPEEKYISGPQRPDSRKECEVILLVGLPGAGKTHWTLNHIKENPEKRYHVIGIDALIAKMTVDGAHRKPLHKGRWEKVYDLGINSLSSLEDIATKRRRNFILDQTNAYASVQRRKMKGFGDFKRIAVVCIPNEEELKRRTTEKSEKGNANTIRESTLNNLRANFSLPSLEFDWFDDIIYTDLNGDEAKEEVKKYNEKGKKELDANPSSRDKRNRREHRYKRDDDRRRYNDRRHDFRNDNRRSDRYGNDRRRDFRNDNRRNDRRGGSLGGGWGGGNQQNWMQNNRSRYDDRYNHRSGGNSGNQQNWGGQNQRNRYDDRYNHRSGGNTGGGRYESYGGGGGGSRDYRDRNNRQQRDFRPGHRDNRTEDSRGGYDRSTASSSKHTKDGYDQYSSNKSAGGKNSSQGGKWSTYGQQAAQQQTQQHANWNQSNQYQQQPAIQQQQYYNYNNMPGYDSQQQWQNAANPNQQQDWMAWWQQQGGNPQQQQQSGISEANQYWSQYSYPTQSTQVASTTEATKKK